jgi:hypothetical protein
VALMEVLTAPELAAPEQAPPEQAPLLMIDEAMNQVSYPVPRNRERSLHTCAQDVQITRMATI